MKREGRLGEALATGLALFLVMAIPFGFVVLGVWWLEDRFGTGVAAVTLGGVLALLAFAGGAVFAYRLSKRTLENAATFVADVTDVQRASMNVHREHARAEREAFSLRARAELADKARVQRLAEQRARLLVDQQRGTERAAAAPTWANKTHQVVGVPVDDEDEEGGQWTQWS